MVLSKRRMSPIRGGNFGGIRRGRGSHTDGACATPRASSLPPPDQKGTSVQDIIEAIIHKAPVLDLTVHVGRSALCLGDRVDLHLLADGRVGVVCKVRRRGFLFTRLAARQIGVLGRRASEIVAPALERGEALRVRIVGLTPEHLASDGRADVGISVFGNPRLRIAHAIPAEGMPDAPDAADT